MCYWVVCRWIRSITEANTSYEEHPNASYVSYLSLWAFQECFACGEAHGVCLKCFSLGISLQRFSLMESTSKLWKTLNASPFSQRILELEKCICIDEYTYIRVYTVCVYTYVFEKKNYSSTFLGQEWKWGQIHHHYCYRTESKIWRWLSYHKVAPF